MSAAADLAREPRAERRRVTARHGVPVGVVVLAGVTAGVVMLARASSGQSAWARQTLQRAAAVVVPPRSPNTILHVAGTETLSPQAQRDAGTTISAVSEQAWFQQGEPWTDREIMQTAGGPVLQESRTGTGQVYNQTANTVYPGPRLPSGKPHYTLTPIAAGRYRLNVTRPGGGVSTQILDADTAQALRDGTQTVMWSVSWNGHTQSFGPMVVPSAKQLRQSQLPNPTSTSFAAELHGLLDSGHARVTKTTTSDGRPAIEISSVNPQSGPRTNYYVNPHTYAPIEVDTFGYDSAKDVTRVHVSTYQTLPLAGNRQLLHITIPPTAQVDRTPAAYWNAAGLPTPF
ncbi:MAG: hypothetical protein ACRDK8_14100 [Solirubrobacteraceae bacterium]